MSYKNYTPIDTTITPSDAAYTANDVVGGLLTLTMPRDCGDIVGVIVSVGEASITLAGTIYFYSASPTSFADNAAFAPVHTDNEKLIGYYTLPTALTLNTRSVYVAMAAGSNAFAEIPFSNGVVYAYYVTSDTPNFTGAAQDVNLRVLVRTER